MAATQSHFRFYADGTESGAVAHAAEDANPTCGPSGTILLDTIFHLRLCLQNDGSVANNVAPQFTYALNGGGYTNITTSSSVVRATASANLTEGANTTQRLSGTGSFESSSAGVTEDGLAGGTAMDLVASGNAETVCSLVVRSADVVNGDVITFRVSGTGITAWTATPTLTVSIPPLSREVPAETLHIDDYGEIQVLGRIRSIDTVVDRSLTGGGLTREVPAETLHISDTIIRVELQPLVAGLAETLHLSETVTPLMGGLGTTLAETLHLSDVATVSLTPLLVTAAETLHLADTIVDRGVSTGVLSRELSETLHIDDYGEIQVLGRIRVIDTIVDRSLTGGAGELTREVPAETLHISDAVTPRMTLGPVTLAETLHISDPVTARMTLGDVVLAETLHLSDVVTPVMQAPPILTASLSEELHAVDGVDSYVALSSIEAVHVLETTLIAELSGATNPAVTRAETLHLADTIVSVFLSAAGSLAPGTLTETLHITETVVNARLTPLQAVLAETLHVREPAVFFGDTLFATVSETVFVFDWGFVSMASIEAVYVLDTDLTAELSTPGQLTRALTETLHLTETPTASLSPLVVALTETLHVSETATPLLGGLVAAVAETLHVTDVVAPQLHPLEAVRAETLHVADTIENRFLSSAGTLDPVLLSETLHLADAGEIQVLGRIRSVDTIVDRSLTGDSTPLVATPFETLHVADAVESWASLDDPEVLHITDTIVNVILSAAGDLSTGTLTETLHLSDVVTAGLGSWHATLTETLHVSDQATVTMGDLATVAATETIHLTDTVTAEMTLGLVAVSETLHLAEAVTARITLGDVTLAETLHLTEAVVGAALAAEGELTTAAAETLHVTDSVTAVLSVLFVTVAPETLHVADTVATGLELAVVRTETLHLTDGPAVPQQVGQPLTVSLTETVTVTEAPTAAVNPLQVSVSETLHVVDDVDIYVAGTLLVTLTETLHVAETVYPERPPVIVGVGVYDFTMTGIGLYGIVTIIGVGIYDPEA